MQGYRAHHIFSAADHLTKTLEDAFQSDTSSTILLFRHDPDWKQAPFLSDTQEVNKVISLSSGALDTDCLELLSEQPRILFCLDQPNEKNMHDQVDSSKPVSNGNTHGGSTFRQSQQRENVCNSLMAVPPCHVVAKKYSRSVATALSLGSDSDILHNGDKLPKRNSRKRGKQCKRTIRKRLNLASETIFEESTYGASPAEVVPTNLLVDKLSETTSSASSLVKTDGRYKEDHVECGIMLNLATLGTDEMDGSGCAGSSYNDAGGRLSSSCVSYLNDKSNTTDSSEFDGSTFTEHGLGEESNSYQKLTCPYVYNPSYATMDSIFSRWNSDNSGNYSVDVEARLTVKDENRHDHSKLGASTGRSNVRMECQLIGSCFSATHAEDTNDPLGIRSYSSKDVTDSCSHTEMVQCSSKSFHFKSGRRNIKSSKTPSYVDLTASNRVRGSNRHKNNGKDSSAVWQKVERNDKMVSKAGHPSDTPVHDKGANEVGKKGVQEDPTRIRAKHNPNKKVCKQKPSNGAVELEPAKGEDALNSCHTFSGPFYTKQAPFLRQQRNSFSKQGSQSLKNYCAPRNGIPKVAKDYLQQEELPMLVLVHAKNTSDKSSSYSSSADEVGLTGVSNNYPTEGNESSQPDIEVAASVSCNLVPDLAPQAASDDFHISDPHSLRPENKGASNSRSSNNLCTDPFAAEAKEARCVKLLTENNSQEPCKWYSAAGHLSQKWVPVGKKETCNGICLDVSANGDDSNLPSERTYKLNLSEHAAADNAAETDYSKMKEVISYVYTAQQRVEDIQLCIGRPIADFENFVYSASPVVHCSSCSVGCKSCLQECVKDGLCLHQTPDITLRTVWQWYEEPSCYGLDVKAQDLWRSKALWNSHCQFTTYFVPYLSAVQLFSQPKRTSGGSIDKESIHRDVTCETSPQLNLPPIFAKLFPKQSVPVNKPSTLRTEDDQQSADGELVFEFFEYEQPYSRRQLFDKVNELIAGAKPSNCQISGDPKNLEASLHDLHPASWYCVAWYPIYRIPDGKFQATFLTYHSLGHWIRRSSSAGGAAVLPVMGLQSYNAKAEWWFEMSKSESEGGQSQASEASEILKERSRTLSEAAAVLSRASVLKNGQMSRNRHPDYEFFLSRS
ncbi:uncharacterized protein [Zea mays]|uniref:uncharacterized protein isoform X2 n=1 Tax=Zea mays TaxID=4577 RepID=UPI0004DE9B81|nr:uncharacterized protein LOC100384849 isoform X2 [Zea mays]XP_008648213.1 uncharacterized protein LOC100384849 isoform X2 [Zea mays]XP_008648214.1 uncharacterized protein LOC100384849 isoform X2 [Zea mays]XP_035815692.1 uncharacterized protein LOC100384849 isoform X2 [Zea mays]|eukprot:XP_008648212.1 uncharacterized protein LOC100384849 isoform X2 [Zea mays]